MADINISELPPITSATTDDVFILNDANITTSRITWGELLASIDLLPGQIQFEAGSPTAPSITFENDTNIGMYSPSLDNLAFSTSGIGRIFIDQAGMIGIGVDNPSDYNAISDNLVIGSPFSGDVGLTIVSDNDSIGSIVFADNTQVADPLAATVSRVLYDHQINNMRIEVNNTEAVRIDEDGFVGIGTSDPDSIFHVSTGPSGVTATIPGITAPIIEAFETQNAGFQFRTQSNRTAGFYFSDPENEQAGSFVYSHSDDSLNFNVQDVSRVQVAAGGTTFRAISGIQQMKLGSNGNVRIGTGEPNNSILSFTSEISGSPSEVAIDSEIVVTRDITSEYVTYKGTFNTEAASFSLNDAAQFKAFGGVTGSGSEIVRQYGFYATSLGNANTNYGFYSDMETAGDFQYYSAGTSPNYFNATNTTFANNGTTALTITGGAIAAFLGTITNFTSTVSDIETANITQANCVDIDFTSTLDGPYATLDTIISQSVSSPVFFGTGAGGRGNAHFRGNVEGDLFGRADKAYDVAVANWRTQNLNYRIVFSDGQGSDFYNLGNDDTLYYNPANNLLTATNVVVNTLLTVPTGNITEVNSTQVNATGLIQSSLRVTAPTGSFAQLNSTDIDFATSLEGPYAAITEVYASGGGGGFGFYGNLQGDVTGNVTGIAQKAHRVRVENKTGENISYRLALSDGISATGSDFDNPNDFENLIAANTLRYNPFSNDLSPVNIRGNTAEIEADDVNTNTLFCDGVATFLGRLQVPSDDEGLIVEGILNPDIVYANVMNVGEKNVNGTIVPGQWTVDTNTVVEVDSPATFRAQVIAPNTVVGNNKGFVGNLEGIADKTTEVKISSTNQDTNYRVLLSSVSGGSDIYGSVFNDGQILYNPNSNLLTVNVVGDVTGNLFGNADTATQAYITGVNVNQDYKLVFARGGDGNQSLRYEPDASAALFYNPNSNVLRATTFQGALDGNAATATLATTAEYAEKVRILEQNNDYKRPLVFLNNQGQVDGTDTYPGTTLRSSTNIMVNPGTNTIFAQRFSGTADNSDTVRTDSTNVDQNYRLALMDGGTGYKQIFTDGQILYNPVSNLLSVSNLTVTNTITGNIDRADTAELADKSTKVAVTNTADNQDYKLVLSQQTGTTYRDLVTDGRVNHLSYNTETNTLTAIKFSGNGSLLTSLNANNLTSGTIPQNRFPSTISANISGIAANATVAATANVAETVEIQQLNDDTSYRLLFTTPGNGAKTIHNDSNNGLIYNPSTNILEINSGRIDANGSLLRALNADEITTGTLNESRLPRQLNNTNVATADHADNASEADRVFMKYVPNDGNGAQVPVVGFNTTANNLTGDRYGQLSASQDFTFNRANGTVKANRFVGSGDGLTNLSAGQITSGTVSAARLPNTLNIRNTGSAALADHANTADSTDNVGGISASAIMRKDDVGSQTVESVVQFNNEVQIRTGLQLNNNDYINFGNNEASRLFSNGSHLFLDVNTGQNDFYLRRDGAEKFRFELDTGRFVTQGEVQIQGLLDVNADVLCGNNITLDASTGNVTATKFVGDGSGLTNIASATGGNSGANSAFFINQNTVTHNYTIPTNYNAMSAGPMEVANNVVVTIPNGSAWSIV